MCLKKDIKSLNWDKVLKIKIFLYKIFEEQPNVYKNFVEGPRKMARTILVLFCVERTYLSDFLKFKREKPVRSKLYPRGNH